MWSCLMSRLHQDTQYEKKNGTLLTPPTLFAPKKKNFLLIRTLATLLLNFAIIQTTTKNILESLKKTHNSSLSYSFYSSTHRATLKEIGDTFL